MFGCRRRGLTEGLLEVRQAGHLRSHVVQVGLQGSTHEQRVGQVCDVDAHDGKGIAEGRVNMLVSSCCAFSSRGC